MRKSQYLANIIAILLLPILLPIFFLLEGCASIEKPIERPFDYKSACGQNDCGREAKWEK